MLLRRVVLGTLLASTLLSCNRVLVSPPASGLVTLLGYVTQYTTNSVAVVDVVRKSVVSSPIPVGQGPVRMLLNPGGSEDYLYVLNQISGTVSFVNRRSQANEGDVNAGAKPSDLTFQQIKDNSSTLQQWLFITNPDDQTVTRVNVSTRNADATKSYRNATSSSGSSFRPQGIVASPTKNEIYVVNENVTQSSQASSSACPNCGTMGSISVLTNNKSSGFDETPSGIQIPGAVRPYRAAIDAKGHFLYVTDLDRAVVYQVDLSANPPTVNTITITADHVSGTSGITMKPDGSMVFVSMPAANRIAAINPSTQATPVYETGGTQPGPLALNNDGSELWIGNVGSNSIYYRDPSGVSCQHPGQMCDLQGPITYNTSGSQVSRPDDILLAPGAF